MKKIVKAYEKLMEAEFEHNKQRIEVLKHILKNPTLLYTAGSQIEAFLGNEREDP